MDKSYLIHNIKLADSAADGHQTTDIELKNLCETSDDITADVTITHNTAGSDPETDSYEGVSLTGAGGGGMANYKEISVKINAYTEGEPIEKTLEAVSVLISGLEPLEDISIQDASIRSTNNPAKIAIPITGETAITSTYMEYTDGSAYAGLINVTPTITGDAEYILPTLNMNGKIKIWGDCEISMEFDPD